MPELSSSWEFLPLFFLVAMLYAGVGHGGASGYLALFALIGVSSPTIAPVALVLNVIAASTGFWNYYRGGHFSVHLFLPFAITSIPAAYLGGWIRISPLLFHIMLGTALLLAAIRILFLTETRQGEARMIGSKSWLLGLPVGFVLGLVSGMIGIGGGVFLSPLLLLLGWADVKKVAAVSAAFIVVNSLGGFAGHVTRGNIDLAVSLPLLAVVYLGALAGSRLSVRRLSPRSVQLGLSLVLAMASLKLLWTAFIQ